jgi:hypothetical protein
MTLKDLAKGGKIMNHRSSGSLGLGLFITGFLDYETAEDQTEHSVEPYLISVIISVV